MQRCTSICPRMHTCTSICPHTCNSQSNVEALQTHAHALRESIGLAVAALQNSPASVARLYSCRHVCMSVCVCMYGKDDAFMTMLLYDGCACVGGLCGLCMYQPWKLRKESRRLGPLRPGVGTSTLAHS